MKWYKRKSFKVVAVPLTLATAGLSSLSAEAHTKWSKYSIQSEFMEGPYRLQTHVDDQLRYAPIAMVYGLNMLGIKGRNNFGERTIILTKILLLQHVITSTMKKGFHTPRPSGEGHSFPSSHTVKAFATATFMHIEYKDVSPWYSVAAYSCATVTGALRVINNHHWLPDVLVGAGIGILSTKLVYLTHQYQLTRFIDRHKKLQFTVLPTYENGATGVYLGMRL